MHPCSSTNPRPRSGTSALLPRHAAVGLLLFIGFTSALNHIAARIAFDDDAGVLLAVMCRAGLSMFALAAVVLWQQHPWRLPAALRRWQLVLGLLIAMQSLCLYSAVARIPVALALLIGNLFPILLVLLTWALGGRPPTRQATLLMALILLGLLLVLDLPAGITSGMEMGPEWIPGLIFAFAAAAFFTVGLWVTDHRLATLAGPIRGIYTITIVFCSMAVAGLAGIVPGGMNPPNSAVGWTALAVLSVLYATTFSVLFILIPRLDMVRNAPVMNSEPVASLILGWLILDQTFNNWQLLGGAIVMACIVALAYSRHH